MAHGALHERRTRPLAGARPRERRPPSHGAHFQGYSMQRKTLMSTCIGPPSKPTQGSLQSRYQNHFICGRPKQVHTPLLPCNQERRLSSFRIPSSRRLGRPSHPQATHAIDELSCPCFYRVSALMDAEDVSQYSIPQHDALSRRGGRHPTSFTERSLDVR